MRTLLTMFLSFFKIGALTIGGGYAMLPVMEHEFVNKRKWVTNEEIVDVFSIAQSLPGVIAINSSVYIGYKIAKFKGALVAALGVILPSFIIIAAIFAILPAVSSNVYAQKAFTGVRAGVAALILSSAINLGKKILVNAVSIAAAITSFILIAFLNVSAIWVILVFIISGVIFTMIVKRRPK